MGTRAIGPFSGDLMTSRRDRKHRKPGHRGSDREARSPFTGWIPFLFVLTTIAAVSAVRLRHAGVPLERDEGEYAYAGQLLLQGIPPYQSAYNMKFPGTYYAYSLILAMFGQTAWGIHVGLLLVNAATTLVLFLVGRRLLGASAGAVAASAFAVLSLDRWIMGVFAHATHFVLLPALLGVLLLLRAVDSKRPADFAGAGALLGVAVLMKQQAVFFLLFGMAVAVVSEMRNPKHAAIRTGLVSAGAAVPFTVLCVVLAAQGVLQRFWFWTFQYAREYVSEVALSDAWSLFVLAWREITQANLPIWILGALGAAGLGLGRWPKDTRLFLVGLLLASFLAICPGFYFREHYFILLLPSVALLVGVAVASFERQLSRLVSVMTARALATLVFVATIGMYVSEEQAYLFSMDTRTLSRMRYGSNPFIEAPEIARYISERTAPGDRIAVLGSEPEIYFYANRRSATGYIYTYALMEPQRYASQMQKEMIQEITAAHPEFLVFVAVSTSWLSRPASDRTILTWADRYTEKCYNLIGVADIYSPDQTAMLWEAGLDAYRPRSENLIYTFRRKGDAPCSDN
jgi:hypothetical protein